MTSTDEPRARNPAGEGSVYYLQSTQKWMVAFVDNDGRRKARTSPRQTQPGAQAFLRTLLKKRDAGETAARSPKLAEYLPTWLEAKRVAGLRPRTLEAYEERITLHVLPSLGAVRLDKITASSITSMYSALLARGLSPTTVHSVHNALRNLLISARRRRLVPHVATEFVEPPRPTDYEARTLTVAEAQHLLASIAEHRHGPLWTFMLGTGCRFGEAAGLTWANVHLGEPDANGIYSNATANIWQQVTRELAPPTPLTRPAPYGVHNIKHSAQRRRHVLAPVKTAAGRRTVPLPGWVVAALSIQQTSIIPALRAASHNPAWAACELVFPNADGGPLRENHVLENWHHALRAAGLEGKPNQAPLRMHDLRHTYGTIQADHGEDLVVIQRTLGHAKSSITADLYVGKVPKALRAASDRFGTLLAPNED